MTVQHYWFHS